MTSAPVSRIHEIEWFRRAREDPPGYRLLATEALGTERDEARRGLLHAVIARAALELHDMDEALTHAEAAAASGVGTRPPLAEPQLRARVLALHSLVLMRLGDLAGAADVLDVDESLDDHARGLIASQRSAVLYCGGELAAALDAANEAVSRLGPDQPVDRARALNNRAIIRLYLGGSAEGLADFVEAEALMRAEGLEFLAADVAHNRGMMLARQGDLPAAIDTFARAEDELAALGAPIDVQLVARAEVLALAGLVEDVVDLLPPVITRLDAAGLAATADEARLTLAIAQSELGDPDAAATAARAREAFVATGRSGWSAIAHDVETQATIQALGPSAVDPGRAADVAEALERAGMQVFSGPSWLRVAACALAAGDEEGAISALARVRRSGGGVIERLLAYEATARYRVLLGDDLGARRRAERGLQLLERHRTLFQATELRVRASAWGDGLASVLVEVAGDDPRELFAAAERWRATALSGLASPPVTDVELSRLLADYRSAYAGLASAVRDDLATAEATDRLTHAERAVAGCLRRRSWADGSLRRPPEAPTAGIDFGASGLIEFVAVGPQLCAVTAVDGSWRRIPIGPVVHVQRMIAATMASLRQLAAGLDGPAARLLATSARAQLDRLARTVVEPLQAAVEDVSELVIVPVGSLHSVPWTRLFGRPVSLAPSAAMWASAGRQPAAAGVPRVVVVGGPGLPGAAAEAAAVAAAHPGAELCLGAAATVEATTARCEGAALLHIASHAQFRRANPLFSHLVLADGPLTGFDLERLRDPPTAIVLSACSTGQVAERSAGEPLGLTSLLLSSGTSAVIASILPLPDEAAAPRMVAFHHRLRAGASAGEALLAATAPVDDGPAELAVSCALACFGRADWRLPN